MIVNSVQRDIALKQGGSGFHSEFSNYREKNGVSMYKKNRGYNANNCGSFTGKEKTAAIALKKGVGDKILTSNWFNKFLEITEEHNVATSAFIALILAGILRPITTMALPGKKDKEDKIYASGHAIASGIMGFIVSTILTSPLDGALTKTFEASEKIAGLKDLKQGETIEQFKKYSSKTLVEWFKKIKEVKDAGDDALKTDKKAAKILKKKADAMKTLLKNMPDWIISVPRAMLTIALIPPILKYVFGIEKKKKGAPQPQMEAPTMNFMDKPVFEQLKGGVK